MATIFVSSVDGSNADNGTTWALAKQTVAGALAIAASNDVIVVDNAGTFTAGAAISWVAPVGNVSIISVTRSGTTSFTPAAGAIEQVGAANANFNITSTNSAIIYVSGMTVKGGTNNNAGCIITLAGNGGGAVVLSMENCTFDLPSAATVTMNLGSITAGTATSYIWLTNCTFNRTGSNATTTYFQLINAIVEIISPTISFTGVNKPTGLVSVNNGLTPASVTIRDGDLSGFSTSGGAIVVLGLGENVIILENLKLSATPALTSGTHSTFGRGHLLVRNCDSANTTYTFQYNDRFGTLTADTSIYVTSGGAVFNGNGASWKLVTTSSCNEANPFIVPKLFVWDTVLTSQTASIEIIRDNATALTDRDIWSDIDSAASASFPNYTYQTNRNTQPFTGTTANQPTSTATWTGTGGFTNANKQKLQNAFTASAAGLLQSRIFVGVGSTTLYIDPYIGGVA